MGKAAVSYPDGYQVVSEPSEESAASSQLFTAGDDELWRTYYKTSGNLATDDPEAPFVNVEYLRGYPYEDKIAQARDFEQKTAETGQAVNPEKRAEIDEKYPGLATAAISVEELEKSESGGSPSFSCRMTVLGPASGEPAMEGFVRCIKVGDDSCAVVAAMCVVKTFAEHEATLRAVAGSLAVAES